MEAFLQTFAFSGVNHDLMTALPNYLRVLMITRPILNRLSSAGLDLTDIDKHHGN
jgi:hypothetical protein